LYGIVQADGIDRVLHAPVRSELYEKPQIENAGVRRGGNGLSFDWL
jgi:hypothetical protein